MLVTLGTPELAYKQELEMIIESGLKTFVEVGNALSEIRDNLLYRVDHDTFEDYCVDKWEMKKSYAHYLIKSADIAKNLSTIVDKSENNHNLPTNEAQVRPLTKLKPEEQKEVWKEAVETAPNGKVTAKHVEKVIEARNETSGLSQPMEVLLSHKEVEYYTPSVYVDAARNLMGAIDLDPASCEAAQLNIKANKFYTISDDGLSKEWHGRVWLNPPYSKTGGKSNQEIWATKLADEYIAGNVTEAILLVKSALGYKWFENLWDKWPVCFARERLSFIRNDGTDKGQSKHGTAFFYLGKNINQFTQIFKEFGRIVLPQYD